VAPILPSPAADPTPLRFCSRFEGDFPLYFACRVLVAVVLVSRGGSVPVEGRGACNGEVGWVIVWIIARPKASQPHSSPFSLARLPSPKSRPSCSRSSPGGSAPPHHPRLRILVETSPVKTRPRHARPFLPSPIPFPSLPFPSVQ
jgi:hypothetical protein